MLFRRKTPRECTTCQYSAELSDQQMICSKRGVVAQNYSCRKYRYDPCKRIPPRVKAPDFEKYNEEDFSLE